MPSREKDRGVKKTQRRRRLLSAAGVDQYTTSVIEAAGAKQHESLYDSQSAQSSSDERALDRIYCELVNGVGESSRLEAQLSHPRRNSSNLPIVGQEELKRTRESAIATLLRCRAHRADQRALLPPEADLSDEGLFRLARFADELILKGYEDNMLRYVPRIVNVVSLATAVPVPGSGTTLPLDLRKIATRCKSAYYAPRRFAAVQLAFDDPRCRVLVFHTGRIVGTGAQLAPTAPPTHPR